MELIKTNIEGLLILKPMIYKDGRGYFFESYNRDRLKEVAPEIPDFVQDNESFSTYGVVRGLHFQKTPYSQAKLVRVVKGVVRDVAVDLRKDSPTFGQYAYVDLSEENHLQFFIPEGFAHGFAVLSPEAVFQYKCSQFYNKESEGGILYCDKDLNIPWGIEEKDMIISDKDKVHPTLRDFKNNNYL